MIKKACKITLISLSMCIFACLFFYNPVAAAMTTRYDVTVPYIKEKYFAITEYARSESMTSITASIDFGDLYGYITEGDSSQYGSFDDSYPTFLCALIGNYPVDSNSIPAATRCVAFDDVSNFDLAVNASQNYWTNVLDVLINMSGTG